MPFCSQCGSSNPEGARFCASCGEPLSSPRAAAGAQAGDGPPPPPPHGAASRADWDAQQGAPVSMSPAKRKNPTAAAAWGLLWGFGAQAFYNGQPVKAVAQIVFNLFVMWGFVFQTVHPDLAWPVGLAVAAVFMVDGYKVAIRINNGEEVGPWTSF